MLTEGLSVIEGNPYDSFHVSFQPYNLASRLYYSSIGLYLNESFTLHQFVWKPVLLYTL